MTFMQQHHNSRRPHRLGYNYISKYIKLPSHEQSNRNLSNSKHPNMQSRLATAAGRSCRVFSTARNKCLRREFVAAAASTGRTTDPAIHYGEVEKGPDVHYDEPLGSSNEAAVAGNNPKNKETDTYPLVPPNPPHVSSSRLESYGVNQPLNPHIQQKRQSSTKAEALGEVICAAVDGTPLCKEISTRKLRVTRNILATIDLVFSVDFICVFLHTKDKIKESKW